MESQSEDFERVQMSAEEIRNLVSSFLIDVLTPGWRQNQIIVLIAIALVAWCLHYLLGSAIERRVRAREG